MVESQRGVKQSRTNFYQCLTSYANKHETFLVTTIGAAPSDWTVRATFKLHKHNMRMTWGEQTWSNCHYVYPKLRKTFAWCANRTHSPQRKVPNSDERVILRTPKNLNSHGIIALLMTLISFFLRNIDHLRMNMWWATPTTNILRRSVYQYATAVAGMRSNHVLIARPATK